MLHLRLIISTFIAQLPVFFLDVQTLHNEMTLLNCGYIDLKLKSNLKLCVLGGRYTELGICCEITKMASLRIEAKVDSQNCTIQRI